MEKGKRNIPSVKPLLKEQKGKGRKNKAAANPADHGDAGWRNLVSRPEVKTQQETYEEKFSRLSGLW